MKCVIGVPIYNSAIFLKDTFKNIDIIKKVFSDYQIIFSYSNSPDSSLELLKKYKDTDNDKVTILNLDNNKSSYQIPDPYRPKTVFIANARNKILEVIQDNYSNYEFFIMLDANSVNYKTINSKYLQLSLNRKDWDSVSFLSTRPNTSWKNYYDLWALSIDPYFISCHHIYKGSKLLYKELFKQLNNLKKGELLPCISAFGGIAIYRTNKFMDCKYSGKFDLSKFNPKYKTNNLSYLANMSLNESFKKGDSWPGLLDCEHRYFHMEAIEKHNARIRIAPIYIFQ